ncbi:hypothetical protein [Pyrobaculum neutrophilum]|uniref:Uncharacterized protein n=1 Tax=Pyrobaculum neutrophilum (strain DSM 2338 / JCM 9278 / NBRC 100436 / V24Sta) TaxID=444157 RepID=B1YAP8_PYRNV|nr:hypothetical protein [Pyrobaculum neutrophilum]ACB39127.1 conserved hypothetical protein [Pyrobaculum neutrophilum V24Sta]
MWLIYFTTAALALLALAGVLLVVEQAYSGTLEAYRVAKFTLDQWTSLASQLNRTMCIAAETKADEAVAALNASKYLELSRLFRQAMEEVRAKTLLKTINYSLKLEGDYLTWEVSFRGRKASGRIDWLRPTALIAAAKAIQSASFDLTDSTVYDVLKPLVPPGAVLTGTVYGYLTGNHTYTGYLHGEYTLVDKTDYRCLPGRPIARFAATHFATLTTNSTSPSIYIYYEVYIDGG